MLVKNKAIVIKTVDYSETSVVLKCLTDNHGIQSYMINGVRSAKGNIKPSHLLPLSLLDLEVYYQQNKTLHRIKELKCTPQLKSIHFDMVKSAVGMFMAEVIHKVVRDENDKDAPLFSFLYNHIQLLDLQSDAVSNYPLYFLLQLSRYLGFFPKGIYSEDTNGFDTKEGVFERYDARNPYQLSPPQSFKISALMYAPASDFHLVQLNNEERRVLLEVMIEYYREHITDFFDLKSHKILAEVLA